MPMRVLTKVEVQGCVYGVVCVRERQRERIKEREEKKKESASIALHRGATS